MEEEKRKEKNKRGSGYNTERDKNSATTNLSCPRSILAQGVSVIY
jgi:hypothetical protein